MFLLSKEKSFINYIVDENGRVEKKGELLSLLDREKYTSLVVEQYEVMKS